MFGTANFSLVDAMKMHKEQLKARVSQLSSRQHSGLMTPMKSGRISRQLSSISTPRLTPFKNLNAFGGGISLEEILNLENKIKGIEDQIANVHQLGQQRKGLDKLQQSLKETFNPDIVEQSRNDVSLIHDD